MAIVYARRQGGKIVGLFANRQEGLAEEEIADDAAEVLAFNGDVHPLATRIKEECGRRIYAVLEDDRTQFNIAAYVMDILSKQIAGTSPSAGEAADVLLARSAKGWVTAMQEASRAMVASSDTGYAADVKWPPPPAGVADFAKRF